MHEKIFLMKLFVIQKKEFQKSYIFFFEFNQYSLFQKYL